MTEAKTVTVAGEKVAVVAAPGWKNWRTLAYGAALVVVPPLVEYVGKIDWTQYVSPTWALVISGAITIGLRLLTNGPAMSDVSVKVKE